MARNTGRGSHSAKQASTPPGASSTWIHRDVSSGHFEKAKESGGSFKKLRKDS